MKNLLPVGTTFLKEGIMSPDGRKNVTSDAVNCVAHHLERQAEFTERKWAGYTFYTGQSKLNLVAFDPEVYRLVPIEDKEVDEE